MIVVFGSINIDFLLRVARLPGEGETVAGQDVALAPGGKGANQALAARRAGALVKLVGAVGNDAFADLALANLVASGVDLSGLRRADRPTGAAFITIDDAGRTNVILHVYVVKPAHGRGAIPQLEGFAPKRRRRARFVRENAALRFGKSRKPGAWNWPRRRAQRSLTQRIASSRLRKYSTAEGPAFAVRVNIQLTTSGSNS